MLEAVKKEKEEETTSSTVASLPIIIKGDVTGSVEAVKGILKKVTHENIALRVIASGIGSVGESDVKTAQTAGGVIFAFHTSIDPLARDLADRTNVPIEEFNIIYELETRAQELLNERAPRIEKEEILGEAKVLKTFSVSGAKQVLGARHTSGTLTLGDQVKIMRRGIDLGRGKLTNLQVARMDVKDIHTEGEFGLQVESRAEISGGDELIAFRITTS